MFTQKLNVNIFTHNRLKVETIQVLTKWWMDKQIIVPPSSAILLSNRAPLVAQWQRIRLPMQDAWPQSLSWDHPLEKEMAMDSSILAWEIPWIEEPGGLQSVGSQKTHGHNSATKHQLITAMQWVESCSSKICSSHNPKYLWMWLYLGRESLQM